MKANDLSELELDTFADVRDANERLGFALDRYLCAHGWTQQGDVPGSFVLWSRTLPDGRTILVNRSMALCIQEHLEPIPDADGDEP